MRPYRLAATILLAVSASTAAAASTNLIEDGGFEAHGPLTSWLSLGAGTAAIPGWRVTAGNVALVGRYFRAFDGTNSLEVGSPGAATVEQTVATLPARRYRLSFALAGNPEGPPRVKQLVVSAGGTTRTFTFDVSGRSRDAMGWARETLEFTARTRSSTIRFSRLDGGAAAWYGPVIDDVSVVESGTASESAPAPATTAAPAAKSTPPAAGPKSAPAATPAATPRPPVTAPPQANPAPPRVTAAPRAFVPAGHDPYSGLWVAGYPGHALRVFLERHGNDVVAHAIDASAAIPAGQIAWDGYVDRAPVVGLGTCVDPTAKGWPGAVIEWAGQDAFHLRVANCHASDVLYTRMR
ncbi:MAG: hypothetical protein NVS3B7_19330 [Candidatus Elarobacter sp.]